MGEYSRNVEVLGKLDKEIKDEQAAEEMLAHDKERSQAQHDKLIQEQNNGIEQFAKLREENMVVQTQLKQRKDDINALCRGKDKLNKETTKMKKKQEEGNRETKR